MITKKQIKQELNLDSVAVINNLLKAAGRTSQVLRSPNLENADEKLIRAALPHVQQGKSYSEAVTLAKQALHAAETTTSNGNGNPEVGGEGDVKGNPIELIQKKAYLQQQIQDKKDEAQSVASAQRQGVQLAEKMEAVKWLTVAAARGSDQVQNSELVTNCRDFALGLAGTTVEDTDAFSVLEGDMEGLGFFNDLLGSTLLEGEAIADSSSSLEQFSSQPLEIGS